LPGIRLPSPYNTLSSETLQMKVTVLSSTSSSSKNSGSASSLS
jgi:hypothetical protein